jgi:hypothetical protein
MNVGKRMILITAMLLVFKLVTAQIFELSAKYQISVRGMYIGEFTIDQKMVDNEITIEAITDVNVRMIFTYQVKYIQQSFYKNGNLWSSHIETLKNGKINSNTRLERQADNYLLTKDGVKTLIDGPITYSGSLLYFQEPTVINLIYNERNGEKNVIKSFDNHTYGILDKKGNITNIYEYQDGILIRAELIHTLATIHLKHII